jgi:hypothetical protein
VYSSASSGTYTFSWLSNWTNLLVLVWVWVWVLCYDRRSVGQSVLEQSTHLGLKTRSWLLSDSCGFVDLGRPLWREDGSVVCNCYWPSPAQSFSGPSPLGLVAIFYCLKFETSLFVASYDSQGNGGGIRPFLHTGLTIILLVKIVIHTFYTLISKSKSKSHCDWLISIAICSYITFSRAYTKHIAVCIVVGFA